ncbi:MAG TPA: polyprenyl diphosphate synthase [Steroidobacteraceae bacterium]|nr:polyprenyl diphosphate synthase [Steroidobacteraceae bacterium]
MSGNAALQLTVGIPKHIAIIMDGNGRWAESRGLPRHAGHKEGVRPVRMCIEECARRGVAALTLFAFSSENWQRPSIEVSSLMQLFLEAMDREVDDLHKNKVRMRFIGDRHSLSVKLQARMAATEELTAANPGLQLLVAVSYGGRWDIVQAARRLAAAVASGALPQDAITEDRFARELTLAGVPDPDLFIRTGGDHRISNFLLWNLAYTELHFCETLWPDFDKPHLENALRAFASRERRFGLTPEQLRDRPPDTEATRSA